MLRGGTARANRTLVRTSVRRLLLLLSSSSPRLLPVFKPLRQKSCPDGLIPAIGKGTRSGVPTNGVISPKLNLCKKLMNSISARGAARQHGKSGLTVIATFDRWYPHTSTWRGRNWTFHEHGKGGRSGDEWLLTAVRDRPKRWGAILRRRPPQPQGPPNTIVVVGVIDLSHTATRWLRGRQR